MSQARLKNNLSDSHIHSDFEAVDDQIMERSDHGKISIDDYILPKFVTKKRTIHYVLELIEKEEFQVAFLRKGKHEFIFPQCVEIPSIE